ncbi:MAG TPA: Mur ligase family protein [Spirochaetota bacterium]|nr:Mur ligase family protein [Spirochaetota bacterium]HOS33597.1 Mur ligase family protein [Spirochaetota bacterium]HOS55564.1 Mur ligase family protein [Spirochaetota bacterium]HPK61746.1 Mur ligase family protein [Spirochaetota bacterium]HQF77511.1 Mur ligase family protein [Spirochaetota bacterium]
MIKNIDDAYDYIYSFINLENKIEKKYLNKEYSLDNIKNIIRYFNIDTESFKIYHVAGTKGKGSVAYFISQFLYYSGQDCASFLSPHLIKPNERILFNLKAIGDEELIDLCSEIKDKLLRSNFMPTTFELFFLIFLLYSKKKGAKRLVVETGLGGRLDATNVLKSKVSVITPIGYDHTNILGDTIAEIAEEKAGIIKNDSITVVSNQYYRCKEVFRRKAKEKCAKVYFLDDYFDLINATPTNFGLNCDFKFNRNRYNGINFNFFGEHQIYNFFTAFLSVFLYETKVINLLNDDMISKFNLFRGRIEVISRHPLIVVDVSHNKESARSLVDALKLHFRDIKWVVISGIATDKDYKRYYKTLSEIADKFIITSLSEYKKSDPKIIFNYAKKINKNSLFIEDQESAFEYALKNADIILATGSFYLVGPFIEYYEKRIL